MTVKSIKIFSSKIIKNNKGNLIKYVSSYDKFYEGFGEIYFNEIKIKLEYEDYGCCISVSDSVELLAILKNKKI